MRYFFKHPEIYDKWIELHGADMDRTIIDSDDPDFSLAFIIMRNCNSFAWLVTLSSLQKPFPKLPILQWGKLIDYGILVKRKDGFVVHPLFKRAIPMRLISSDVRASEEFREMSLRSLSSLASLLAALASTSLEESLIPPSSLRLVWIPPEQRLGFQDQGHGIHLDMILQKDYVLSSR